MPKLLFLSLLFFVFQKVYAQSTTYQVSGVTSDSITVQPLADVTVTLLRESTVLKHSLTNDSGYFLFQELLPGSYSLNFSNVGYVTKTITLQLGNGPAQLDLGKVQLAPQAKQLAGVTVTAQKPLIEDKGDRLIYNAEQDISNAGGTAADVLRKVPNLTVDLNGNVQMRGNSNIKILVNGKPSAMMARNLADALRQMPANVIKTIEVITSPGARYDAEGAAGVINIITKKGLKGMNGSVNASVGNMNRGLGGNIGYRKGKVGINLSANGYQNRNINENASTRTALVNGLPASILERSSSADNTGTGGYGEMSFDYDPDSSHHLNFSANVWGGDFPSNNTTFNRLIDPSGNVMQAFRNESRFKNPYGNGQLDFGYTKIFKKADQEFSVLTQYSRMPDNYFYTTDRYEEDKVIYREESTNYSRNKEYTGQTDYTHPFVFNGKKDTTTLKLEIGAKAIIRDIGSESRVAVDHSGQGMPQPDPAQANDFDYVQKVISGYTSLRLNNRRKWSVNAGTRIEHTQIKGEFITTGTNLNSHYNNIIPNVSISKGIKKHTWKLNYTQRITRPMIWYLNPWVNRSDPKNISTGNPALRPELNHMAEVGHSINTPKGLSLNTTAYARITDNAIEYLSVGNAEGIISSRPENIAQRENYGLSVNISSRPNKNWNLNGGGNVSYIDIRSRALRQRNSGFVWYTNINTTYKLPKDVTLQAYSSLNSGWISLQRTGKTLFYWYGFSAKREFWDKKASLNLSVNNPFAKGISQHSVEKAPTFIADSRFLFVNRSARLTFEWRFGQMSTDGGRQGKKIRNDDSGR